MALPLLAFSAWPLEGNQLGMHDLRGVGVKAKSDLDAGDAAVNAILLESGSLCPRGLKQLGSRTGTLRTKQCARSLHKMIKLILKGSVLVTLALEFQMASKRGEAREEFNP